MDETTTNLITAVRVVYGEFMLSEDFSVGSVGAAIRTEKGNTYTGSCIDLACRIKFYAEAAAVAEIRREV